MINNSAGVFMNTIKVTFLGSGDAFSSGGRFHTCILVKATRSQFLVDCGASAMIAIRRFDINPNDIDMILLTHLHGDHFGGIPFFVLDAQLISKRTKPLVIAGPPGTKKRVVEAMEVMFPGSSTIKRRFPLEIVEFDLKHPKMFGQIRVTPYLVQHPCGDPPLALRIECEEKVITYTGDTEWTETLIPAAKEADLLIAECYFFDKKVKYHLDFQTLMAHLPEIQPKKIVVTHMSEDMLARLDTLDCEYAEDGKVIDL
jgi:ribonuclease BN (tRNA processing enzyme)